MMMEGKSLDRQMIGQFRVEKLLGAGGMSVVYKCTDLAVNRPVAIKVLQKHLAFEERWLLRFRQEAVAIGRLSHPNIVRVHHFESQVDEPFIVMDYVDGVSLSDSISFGGALPPERAIMLIGQVMDALAHAHAHGVVHRDIKPSNIMIANPNTSSESARLLDFGIAKLGEEEANYKLTQTGEILGSPLYMSPEQCAGRPAFERSDQYSLGCVLFECLTGHPPFVGDGAVTILVQHMNNAPPSLRQASLGRNFSPSLETVLKTLLQKNPEQRYASMSEAKVALEAALSKDIASTSVFKLNIESGRQRSFLVVAAIISGGLSLLVLVALFVQSMLGSDAPVEPRIEQKAIISTEMEGDYGDKAVAEYLGEIDHNLASSLDTGAHGFKLMTDKSLAVIAKMPNLGLLRLTNCGNITGKGFQYLWDSPRLDNLDVTGIMMSDEKVRAISKIKNLVHLNLNATNIHSSSLEELAAANLHSLAVCNDNIDDDGCRAIAKISSLQVLDIGQNPRAGEGLKYLAALPKLDTLFASNIGLNDEDLISCPIMKRMRVLDLSHSHIDDAAVSKLALMKNLERLNLGHCRITDKGFLQLSELDNLQQVGIQKCKVTDEAILAFKKKRPDCKVSKESWKRQD